MELFIIKSIALIISVGIEYVIFIKMLDIKNKVKFAFIVLCVNALMIGTNIFIMPFISSYVHSDWEKFGNVISLIRGVIWLLIKGALYYVLTKRRYLFSEIIGVLIVHWLAISFILTIVMTSAMVLNLASPDITKLKSY